MTTRWALSLLLIGGVTSFNDDTVMIQSRIQAKVSDRPLPATAIGSPEHCQESVVKEEPDESPLDEDVPHFDFEDLDFDSEMDAMAVAEEDAKQKVPQVRKFYDGEESYNSVVFYEVTRDADAGVIEARRATDCASLYTFLTNRSARTTTPGKVTRASVYANYAEDKMGTEPLHIALNDLLYDNIDDFWAILKTADDDPLEQEELCAGLKWASARLMDPDVLRTIEEATRLKQEVSKETGCGYGIDVNFCIGMTIKPDETCRKKKEAAEATTSALAVDTDAYCDASQLYSLSAYSSDCDMDINIAQMITVAKKGRQAMASLGKGTHDWSLALKIQNIHEKQIEEEKRRCETVFNVKMNGLEIDLQDFEETIFQEKGVDWQWRYQQQVISEESQKLALAVGTLSEQKFLATGDKITCLGVLVQAGKDADQERLSVPSCLMEEEMVSDLSFKVRSTAVKDFLAGSLKVQFESDEIVVASLNVATLEAEMNTLINKVEIVQDGVAAIADGVADGVAAIADGVAAIADGVADGVDEAAGVAAIADGVAAIADGVAARQLMKLQGHPDAHFGAKKDRKVIAPPNAFEREHLAKQGAELAKSTTKKAESGDPDVAKDIPEVEVEAPEEPEPRPVDFVPTAAELLESQQACVNQLTAEDCHSRTNCDWTNGCSEKSQ